MNEQKFVMDPLSDELLHYLLERLKIGLNPLKLNTEQSNLSIKDTNNI